MTIAPRDVRRPATIVGSVVLAKYPATEVWVHPNGKTVYLATMGGGGFVYTIDVSNPAQPVISPSDRRQCANDQRRHDVGRRQGARAHA